MATIAEQLTNIHEGEIEISSTLSYLLGVSIANIQKMPQRMSHFQRLDNNKHARIIRCLSILRTDIMKNYRTICDKLRTEYTSILMIPELVSGPAIRQLDLEGVVWHKKSNTLPEQHLVEINRIISDRINNCKKLFPLWLDWNYIRSFFIMPNGFTKAGVKAEIKRYRSSERLYPYQMYLNWQAKDVGNILYNDRKIVEVMYEQNGDTFTDTSKVCDIGNFVKDNVYSFIDQSRKLVIAVDCENTDPYKLCAALRGLDLSFTKKISKIILFDDVNTGSLWRVLEEYTTIPVEYKLVERITKFKSLVDTTLTATVSKEHYLSDVDSFILVSSDSDYWGMISSLTGARFLLMVERDSCGDAMKATLRDAGVFFCYLDDFYTGNCQDIKYGVLLREIREKLATTLDLNMNTVLDNATSSTRAAMSESERKQFFEKYLRRASLTMDEQGNLSITI